MNCVALTDGLASQLIRNMFSKVMGPGPLEFSV